MSDIDRVVALLAGMAPTERAQVEADARKATSHLRWIPNPGPQTDAYFCPADELLYGGEVGGGKSELGIGLSLTVHRRSLCLRRTTIEGKNLFDRYGEIIGNTDGKNKYGWRIDGRVIDIGGCQYEQDKQKRKGIPHDLKFFDELVDFSETQYLFIITWNRSADPNQRCRIVASTNPPTMPEGMWVVRRWAAWLDPTHPNPAKDGELRWFATVRGKDTEVSGPGPVVIDGEPLLKPDGKPVLASSRTFIRSKLTDNPDLAATNYSARLDSLPEDLQGSMRDGRFDAALRDQPFQVIPTDWIRAAQDRWTDRPPAGVPMCAIGVDCSGGGKDPMVLAPRHDGWYSTMISINGKDIPADRPGKHGGALVLSHRRDKAMVIIDMGGGYGNALYEFLLEVPVTCIPYKGAAASVQRTKDGQLMFYNVRSQAIWRFKEALDPSQPNGSPIMLPPSQSLLADLAAPTYKLVRQQHGVAIQVEPKEQVVERLGRSTNEGDAVVMAWFAGPTYVSDGANWAQNVWGGGRGHQSGAIMGRRPLSGRGR